MEEPTPLGDGDCVVEPGDCIVSIAARHGHLPDTIWNDPANQALKDGRDKGEVLLPGDRVTVMPLRIKEEPREAGAAYVFKRIGVPVKFTLVLQDDEGNAFAGKKYELTVEGKTQQGTSDDTGKIECFVDPLARDGELKVWLEEPGLPNPWTQQVQLSALCPVAHTLGVQQRLANLGYYTGALDGIAGPGLAAAITLFQTEQQMEVTGEADQTTRDKLVELHKV
ncbi:MAG TPA: peptidoglycan-binding domain-containing protein [Thermoanaerobaculia bacterium]|nr:peptidoglycan-binding domain-containing protein [Thermoanaerobaculia bacterium]